MGFIRWAFKAIVAAFGFVVLYALLRMVLFPWFPL